MNKKKSTSVKSTKKSCKKQNKQEIDEDNLPCITLSMCEKFDPSSENFNLPDDFNCEPDYEVNDDFDED